MSAAAKESTLKLTQRKSGIGFPENQKRTLRALGLSKIGRTSEVKDSPQIRGMIARVSHLIEVEEG